MARGPLTSGLRGWAGKVLDFVFTPRCAGCGREGAYVCQPCLLEAHCLPAPFRPKPPSGGAPAVAAVFSAYAMDGVVRQAVHELKYRGVRALAAVLAPSLTARATEAGVAVDLVVPVPLHPRRLRERGYNQAALLGREVAGRLGLPLELHAVRRVRHGRPQVRSAGIDQRWDEVRAAFAPAAELHGERLFLVDDVCTTGATLDACADALREAGAGTVWGLTVAREL